jgi:signal transduction histidine kinase/membrane protein implicated in regulation of membrane protease activity
MLRVVIQTKVFAAATPLVSLFAFARPASAAPSPWTQQPGGWTIAAAVIAIWLVIAVWALVRAAQDRKDKQSAEGWGLRLRSLLDSTPQAYLVVEPNGHVHSSDQLRRWLGLSGSISSLQDLAPQVGTNEEDRGSGLSGPDFDLLMADVAALKTAGQAFTRLLHTEAAEQILQVQGRLLSGDALQAATSQQPAICLWFADVTRTQGQSEQLSAERRQLASALDATSGLIELAPFPVWQRDSTLAIRQVNRAYVQAVEAKHPGDVIEQQIELIANPGPLPPRAAAARARELKAVQTRTETVVIGGMQRRLRIYDVPIEGVGIGGFALDVSDVDEARGELQRFASAQRDMLDSLSTPVMFFDVEQRMTFSNAALARLFDLDPTWLGERPSHGDVLDRLRDLRRIPEQVDFRSWRQKQLDIYADISGHRDELWHLPDERALRVVSQPHPGGGAQVVIEDVTQQLSLQRSVSTLSKVQNVTLNNLHEGVALIEPNGHVRLSNTAFAQLMGLSADWLAEEPEIDEAINRASHLTGLLDQRQDLQNQIRAMVNSRRPIDGALSLQDNRHITYSGTLLPDGSALLTLIDVTDTRTKQKALEDSNRALASFNEMRSRFIENTSYELRTPLTSIMGFTEMLEQGFLGDLAPKQRDYLRDILKSSQKLDALIGDLLDLTLLGSKTVVIEKQDVDIVKLLQDVLRDAQPIADAKSLTVTLNTAALTTPIVEMDRNRMQQAFSKVLDNAILYTPQLGHVSITARSSTGSVLINIVDDGPGMSELDQAQVFEVFHRGTSSSGQKGVGLGLTLVRHIMDAHGGSVEITSTVGKGTNVEMRLPLAATQNAASVRSLFV